jgi:hypothetical protein
MDSPRYDVLQRTVLQRTFDPGADMPQEYKERWLELCEQASVEQDRNRLLRLINEIGSLLAEKGKNGTVEQRVK